MNKKQICEHLASQWHRDEWTCKPKNVAQSGNWIFHVHPDYPDEADCLPRHRNAKGQWVISSEFWDSVPTSESPVGTKDKATIAATVAKLDDAYRDHLIECDNGEWIYFERDTSKRFAYQLRAYAGDCAAGGLSEEDEIIPFTEDKLTCVYDYLIAETAFFRAAHVHGVSSELAGKACRHYYDCAHRLEKKKVFKHKWHARTQWILEDYERKLENDGGV